MKLRVRKLSDFHASMLPVYVEGSVQMQHWLTRETLEESPLGQPLWFPIGHCFPKGHLKQLGCLDGWKRVVATGHLCGRRSRLSNSMHRTLLCYEKLSHQIASLLKSGWSSPCVSSTFTSIISAPHSLKDPVFGIRGYLSHSFCAPIEAVNTANNTPWQFGGKRYQFVKSGTSWQGWINTKALDSEDFYSCPP